MLPLFLNVENRLCVVVGGGPVGQRKARALLDAGAKVRLICLEKAPMSAERLNWVTEPYQSQHLDSACLVVAAATPAVNARVIADARERGLLVNSAYDPAAGDFYFPSVVRRGEFVLAIGTMGAAPALSRRVRERLETDFDEAFGTWVRLLGEMRPEILFAVPDASLRHAIFTRLSDWDWLERLRREDESTVREAMRAEAHRVAERLIE